jgi:hypothetical protein
MFSSYLEFRAMKKLKKPIDSECYTPVVFNLGNAKTAYWVCKKKKKIRHKQ